MSRWSHAVLTFTLCPPTHPGAFPARARKEITMVANRSRFMKHLAVAGALAAIACPGLTSNAWADETTPKADAAASSPIKVQKPMKMDQPMAGEMKKDGVMKGDVLKAAEK